MSVLAQLDISEVQDVPQCLTDRSLVNTMAGKGDIKGLKRTWGSAMDASVDKVMIDKRNGIEEITII